jgi:hypothetical protein
VSKKPIPTLDGETSEPLTSNPASQVSSATAELMDPVEGVPGFVYTPVPTDRDEALKLACEGVLDSFRHSCIRYWNVGRIMSALEERKEKNVVQELMAKTRLEERTVRYMLAFFRRFQDIEKVVQLSNKGIGWSQFKQLTAISKDTDREKLVTGVLADKIEPEKLDTEVDKLKAKDKKTGKDAAPKRCSAVKFFNRFLHEAQNNVGKMFETKADLTNIIGMLDQEEMVAEEECQQCVSIARELKKTLASLIESYTLISDSLQAEVVDAYASPTKPVRPAGVPGKGNPSPKPAAGK